MTIYNLYYIPKSLNLLKKSFFIIITTRLFYMKAILLGALAILPAFSAFSE